MKRIQNRLQSRPAQGQQPQRSVDSPYLTFQETVRYLRLKTRAALYYHIRENRLPTLRRGHGYLFDKRALDAWLLGVTEIDAMRKRA